MTYSIVQVYWYWDEITGEYRHRIHAPAAALAQHVDCNVTNVHVYHPLFPQLALQADLVVLHLTFQSEIGRLIALRRTRRMPTVFEIPDNFLQAGSWVPPDDPHRNPYVRQNILHHAMACDGVQVSTPALLLGFGRLHERVAVFENQIDTPDAAPPEREPGFVFGWGGSRGHEDDLAWIAPAVISFCRQHPKAVFAYMGDPAVFHRYFDTIGAPQRRLVPTGDMDAWFAFIRGLHVGLAPLRDTPFNRSRSDGKFLEYAAHGAVAVLSDLPVYAPHAKRAVLWRDPKQLEAVLADLYAHPQKVRDLAFRAHTYVREARARSLDSRARDRFYSSLFTEVRGDVAPGFPAAHGLIQKVREAGDLYRQARYADAVMVLKDVLSAFPGYHLAELRLMKVWNKMGQKGKQQLLDTFAGRTPHPLYADLVYENLCLAAEHSDPVAASQWLACIEDPVRRAHVSMPQNRAAEDVYRENLRLKPYDYLSLTQLSGLTTSPDEAAELASRLAFMEGRTSQ